MIDKAERYLEEALTGKKAAKEAKYKTSKDVEKLIAFVEWASKRGGDAWNDTSEKPIDEMTEEEKELQKPFWAKSYTVGK